LPHRASNAPVIEALESADIIILDSPCYGMGMSWTDEMFSGSSVLPLDGPSATSVNVSKIGCSHIDHSRHGAEKVTKDMERHFFYMGVPLTYPACISESVQWIGRVYLLKRSGEPP
jgi:hypothetical protein